MHQFLSRKWDKKNKILAPVSTSSFRKIDKSQNKLSKPPSSSLSKINNKVLHKIDKSEIENNVAVASGPIMVYLHMIRLIPWWQQCTSLVATHPSIMLAGIGKSVKYRRLLPLPLPSLFPQEMSSLIYSDSLLTSLTLHAIPKYLTTNHH